MFPATAAFCQCWVIFMLDGHCAVECWDEQELFDENIAPYFIEVLVHCTCICKRSHTAGSRPRIRALTWQQPEVCVYSTAVLLLLLLLMDDNDGVDPCIAAASSRRECRTLAGPGG